MKSISIAIILVLLSCSFSHAAACSWSGNTGTVAAPYAAADVSACVSDASSLTGAVIIQIPDSTPAQTETITVNMRSGFTNVTGLTIRGQNDCTLDSNGIPTACGTNITNLVVSYTGLEGKAFRLAHMQINGTSGFRIDGDGKSWRFDHLFWNGVTGAGINSGRVIWINKGAAAYMTDGLIDHNYVYYGTTSTIFLHYQALYDGGNAEWMGALGLGTANAFYLENNSFFLGSGTLAVTDCNGAGRFVARYNSFHNSFLAAHDAIVTNARGVRKWEVYNNTFEYDTNGNWWVGELRGGTGVFFNNTIVDPIHKLNGSGVGFVIYRTFGGHGGDPWTTYCSHNTGCAFLNSSHYPVANTCGSGTGNVLIDGTSDGSGDTPDGWPCRDQVGYIQAADGSMVSKPFLFWNNTLNGVYQVAPFVSAGVPAGYIVEGREYCVAGHTSGGGWSGDAVTIPAICNGVTTTYASYSYPHPLQGSGCPGCFACAQGLCNGYIPAR